MKKPNIEIIFSDVDGTLTDGRLYYGAGGEEMKVFHVKDGHGIKNWQNKGKKFCVITARSSQIVQNRMTELGISDVIMGSKDKIADIDAWLKKNNADWSNLAYIGDDINDLDVIKKSSFSASPSDGALEVQKAADYICTRSGGLGCVRELIDHLLEV